MAYKTLPSTKVPVPMREPFILTGYRLLNQPWTYYVISLFRWHNETLAVWSHILATIIITGQTLYYGKTYDLLNDPEGNKILMFSIGCISMTSMSAIAHLMCSKSTKINFIFFLLDYSGITLYSYSIGIASIYVFSDNYIHSVFVPIYIPATVVIATVTFIMNSLAKLRFTGTFSWQRKALMVVPYIIFGLWLGAPVLPRYWNCYHDVKCDPASLNHITSVIFFFIVTGAVYSSHLPEKWRPGRYDNIGQSHQAFHLCSLATILMHLASIRIDIETGLSQQYSFNLRNGLLGFVSLFMINNAIIIYQLPQITKMAKQFQQKCHR